MRLFYILPCLSYPYILILLIIFCTFTIINSKNDNIINGISIKGIEEETSKMYVNKNISEKQYVRVIPIKAMEYEEFIIEKLQKIGKFYAQILDDEIVRIYIQFDKGENLEKFTDIDKTIFKEYFVITEENE